MVCIVTPVTKEQTCFGNCLCIMKENKRHCNKFQEFINSYEKQEALIRWMAPHAFY